MTLSQSRPTSPHFNPSRQAEHLDGLMELCFTTGHRGGKQGINNSGRNLIYLSEGSKLALTLIRGEVPGTMRFEIF
jgi:hypothetical protein